MSGTPEQKEMVQAMQKAGGDPNKLDPAMREKIEQASASNPMSTANRQGMPSGMPTDYPARS